MSYENITLEDCIEMYYMKDKAATIIAGQVKDFVKEEEKQ